MIVQAKYRCRAVDWDQGCVTERKLTELDTILSWYPKLARTSGPTNPKSGRRLMIDFHVSTRVKERQTAADCRMRPKCTHASSRVDQNTQLGVGSRRSCQLAVRCGRVLWDMQDNGNKSIGWQE